MSYACGQCGKETMLLCSNCHNCMQHCSCTFSGFDADELGLDPETDNTPQSEDRHA